MLILPSRRVRSFGAQDCEWDKVCCHLPAVFVGYPTTAHQCLHQSSPIVTDSHRKSPHVTPLRHAALWFPQCTIKIVGAKNLGVSIGSCRIVATSISNKDSKIPSVAVDKGAVIRRKLGQIKKHFSTGYAKFRLVCQCK
jgi:hypothetical protein